MHKILTLLLLLSFNLLLAKDFKNDLQYETSPYLKQHENNPVHWLPWGEKAFEKAKRENKPIFLSIGFSTCHWCHVMDEESYSKEKIAQLLNKYYVAIKVDREEMPHIDSYYQELYKKVKHRTGGWPLAVFMSANKQPFYISTYIPAKKASYSDAFDTILSHNGNRYINDYKSILIDIMKIKNVKEDEHKELKKLSPQTLSNSLKKQYDDEYGGFGHTKKFPETSKLSLMLDLALINNDKELLEKSYYMLDMMGLRGLYDHIEGGFFRYTTDNAWEIAHFEKMLYNQAELIPLYTRAYRYKKNDLYKNIVRETISMINQRFVEKNLFYSASDTDSEGKEGYYFTYTPKEIENALQKNSNAEELEDSLEFITYGNFHGDVHLNFYTKNRPKGFELFRDDLLKLREKKKYPFIDKKIITAWNAMMIEALYIASSIDIKYKNQADKHLQALQELMFDKGELFHQTILGVKPTQLALLEDYSFFISALIAAYQVDFDTKKLNFANYLFSRAKEKFYKNGIWYLSDDKLKIKANLNDKYYTSALSKMLQNILKLASLKESFKYEKLAVKSLNSIVKELSIKQSDAPAAAIAYLMQSLKVVTLKANKTLLQKNEVLLNKIKYPYVLRKSSKDSGYLACTIGRCFSKEDDLNKIVKAIENNFKSQ